MRQERYVRLTGMAQGAEIRTAMFEDREHVVVPVIALVGDAVVRPMNSKGPELVPAEELAMAPSGWDGRPVLPDHPNGGKGSANEPTTLERMSFGRMFHTLFENGKLKTEAWLDPERAAKVGRDAVRVIERCRAGESVEVSVGAWVTAEERAGIKNGMRYEAVWRDIVPDHLAMLPEGAEGACSVDMGCGAPRAARKEETMERANGWLARVLGALGLRQAEEEGVSDAALREALWDALRAAEPGFEGIVEVFPDSGTVIYMAMPEREPMWLRRTYTVGEDGAVGLGEDRESVRPVTRYEPVAAQARAACGCKERGEGQAARAHNDEGGSMKENVKELVGRLIANEASPFTEADAEHLAAFGEARLVELAEGYEVEPEAVAEPDEEPKTEEEWLAQAPESLRRMVGRYQAEEKARRSKLIGSLKAAQSEFSEGELAGKPTEELEALSRLVKLEEPKDYSGRGVPVNDGGNYRPPDPYGIQKEAN